ncbi:MAG: hypothetical protein IT529_19235 [Burkholderiales bacterium]|nr:hypothetical protein [Burkholderiales bacterium]
MRRFDCLKRLAAMIPEETLVVCNLQDTTYEWQHLRPSDGNLLRQGMGCVSPVAFGLALSLPKERVVALDGDGSMLLGLGMLTTLGRYAPKNLLVLVFDNECYFSTTRAFSPGGVQRSATAFGVDFEPMARGAGIGNVVTVTDVERFEQAVGAWLRAPGMCLVVVKLDDHLPEKVPMPTIDGKENKYRFIRFVERIERREILPTEEEKSFRTS